MDSLEFDEDERTFQYGQHIKSARKKSKLTQIEAAGKLDIAVNSLRLYEANKRTPSLKVMAKMADLYNVTLDYLTSGKDYNETDSFKVRLLNAFLKLNSTGKRIAAERVEELMEIERYRLPVFQNINLRPEEGDPGAVNPKENE